MEGKENFDDIEESLTDIKVVQQGLKRLGFTKDEIVVLKNPEHGDVLVKMNETMNQVYMNSKAGDNTLMYCYYAGHGFCDNNTYIICTDGKSFPLEKYLRIIGRMDQSYVIGLFDCCREKIAEGDFRGGKKIDLDSLMNELEENDPSSEQTMHTNYLVTFGCPPSKGVPAKSTIAVAYFKFLKKSADDKGRIVLPGPLNFFLGTDGKCETISKVRRPIVLQWTDLSQSTHGVFRKTFSNFNKRLTTRKDKKLKQLVKKRDSLSKSTHVSASQDFFNENQGDDEDDDDEDSSSEPKSKETSQIKTDSSMRISEANENAEVSQNESK